MNKTVAVLSTVSLITLAGAGLAASYGSDGDKRFPEFSELDLNGDNQISKVEMTAHAKTRFDGADQNSDGMLSAAEMTAEHAKASEQRINKMIEKMDANKDGQVSFEEIQNGRKNRKQEKMFNKLDDNGDGFISAEEFAEMKDHRRGKWFKFFAKDQKDDGQTND